MSGIVSRAELLRRFKAKFSPEPNSGCWLWFGATTSGGRYGQFRLNGRGEQAHRASYMLFRGPIPEGLVLDHLCQTPFCVNPAHLEPVTTAENIRRGGQLLKATAYYTSKTHCPSGHPYSGRNLLVIPRTGHRQCRECNRARARRWSTQRRAKAKALR